MRLKLESKRINETSWQPGKTSGALREWKELLQRHRRDFFLFLSESQTFIVCGGALWNSCQWHTWRNTLGQRKPDWEKSCLSLYVDLECQNKISGKNWLWRNCSQRVWSFVTAPVRRFWKSAAKGWKVFISFCLRRLPMFTLFIEFQTNITVRQKRRNMGCSTNCVVIK